MKLWWLNCVSLLNFNICNVDISFILQSIVKMRNKWLVVTEVSNESSRFQIMQVLKNTASIVVPCFVVDSCGSLFIVRSKVSLRNCITVFPRSVEKSILKSPVSDMNSSSIFWFCHFCRQLSALLENVFRRLHRFSKYSRRCLANVRKAQYS